MMATVPGLEPGGTAAASIAASASTMPDVDDAQGHLAASEVFSSYQCSMLMVKKYVLHRCLEIVAWPIVMATLSETGASSLRSTGSYLTRLS